VHKLAQLGLLNMANFFAALDSDDEQPNPVPAKAVEKKNEKPAPRVVAPVAEPSKVPRRNDREDRSSGRGRAPPREGKRAYDRRSGTGRGKEIKKGGGGRGNWGSDKNEARNAEQHTVIEENAEGTKVDVPEGQVVEEAPVEEEAEAPAVEEEQPEPEPEDTTMTLEEYLAKKAEEQKESEAFAPVREKQLEVDDAFQKMALKKEEEDFLVLGGIKNKAKKGRNKEAKKQTLDVDIRVGGRVGFGGRGGGRGDGRRRDDHRSEGAREGGRGTGRGERRGGGRDREGGRDRVGGRDGGRGRGRGRVGGRGEAGRGQSAPSSKFNPADESAFPSL